MKEGIFLGIVFSAIKPFLGLVLFAGGLVLCVWLIAFLAGSANSGLGGMGSIVILGSLAFGASYLFSIASGIMGVKK